MERYGAGGGLIGYGPNRNALRKRMTDQIAQIFRGAASGDIAIGTPTVLEFVVNRKIARLLDLNILSAVLALVEM